MKTLFKLLITAALPLVGNSCMSMGGAPAAELKQQLTLELASVDVGNNRARINGTITASKDSSFTEVLGSSPSLVVVDQYEGKIDTLLPIRLVDPRHNEHIQEKRVSLAAGESDPFSITLQLAPEFPNRTPIPGMLYLSSDNGVSGHLVEPNCALVMKVVHLLSDNKEQNFDLSAEKELLVVVVDGRLGVKLME